MAVEQINDLRKKLAGISVIKSQLDLRITLSEYQEVSLKANSGCVCILHVCVDNDIVESVT